MIKKENFQAFKIEKEGVSVHKNLAKNYNEKIISKENKTFHIALTIGHLFKLFNIS